MLSFESQSIQTCKQTSDKNQWQNAQIDVYAP